LFDRTEDATDLKLVDTRSFGNGAEVLTYHVERAS
jgi:hypothetical protein